MRASQASRLKSMTEMVHEAFDRLEAIEDHLAELVSIFKGSQDPFADVAPESEPVHGVDQLSFDSSIEHDLPPMDPRPKPNLPENFNPNGAVMHGEEDLL